MIGGKITSVRKFPDIMNVTAPDVIDTSPYQDVALYTDYKHDESYTPTRISVRVGTNFNDLQEIEVSSSFPFGFYYK